MSMLHHRPEQDLTPIEERDQIAPNPTQTPEDPALNAGSSSIIDTADLESYHAPDPLEHHAGWRRRALRIGAVGTGIAVVVTGAFFVGRSGTKEEKANPTPTTLDFPAPGVSKPSVTPSTVFDISKTPNKTPFGQPIEYKASPDSIGKKKHIYGPGAAEDVDRNIDLSKWSFLEAKPVVVDAMTKSGRSNILAGCASYARTYEITDGTQVKTRTLFVNPPTTTFTQGGVTKEAYYAAEDSDSFAEIAVERNGSKISDDSLQRVAFGHEDVQITPINIETPTIHVSYKSTADVTTVSGQHGEGGIVATVYEQPNVNIVVGRPVTVVGEMDRAQVTETCRQLVLKNSGLQLSAIK